MGDEEARCAPEDWEDPEVLDSWSSLSTRWGRSKSSEMASVFVVVVVVVCVCVPTSTVSQHQKVPARWKYHASPSAQAVCGIRTTFPWARRRAARARSGSMPRSVSCSIGASWTAAGVAPGVGAEPSRGDRAGTSPVARRLGVESDGIRPDADRASMSKRFSLSSPLLRPLYLPALSLSLVCVRSLCALQYILLLHCDFLWCMPRRRPPYEAIFSHRVALAKPVRGIVHPPPPDGGGPVVCVTHHGWLPLTLAGRRSPPSHRRDTAPGCRDLGPGRTRPPS